MRLRGTWKIGRIAGIEVGIHPSWLIIYAMFAWSAMVIARMYAPQLHGASNIVLGLIASLMLFASVVAHEFAHALVARRLGIPIGGITLFLFGGVATIESEPATPADELRMALAGPALSIVLAFIFFGLATLAMATNAVWLGTLCIFLAWTNGVLAVFNLLPAFPSDGGRVLRALIWMMQRSQPRATLWASRVSLIVAVSLVGAGLYFVVFMHLSRGLWWMIIGTFLAQAALTSGRQARVEMSLEAMQVRDCMLKTLIPVPAGTMVANFIGLAGHPGAAYPVVDQGSLVGLANVQHTAGVPLAMWNQTPVSQVMVPIAKTPALNGAESAREALAQLREHKVDELPVYDDGELVGIVTRDSIYRRLHARRPL